MIRTSRLQVYTLAIGLLGGVNLSAQSSDGPDLPTTTNWILEKLNKSRVQLDTHDQCG